jgi:hypothetical protein
LTGGKRLKEQVWVRNIDLPGVWPGSIAENLARYMIFKRAIAEREGPPAQAA